MITRAIPPSPEESRALLDDESNEEDASSSDNVEQAVDNIEVVGPKPLVVEQEVFRATDVPDEEQLFSLDQPVASYETSQWEIWSYYMCYAGNTGLASFYFAPMAFQNVLSQAAGDEGTLYFAGR